MRTPDADRIWKENKRKLIGTCKIRCKCGRKIIVKRENGRAKVEQGFMCGTCKILGLEKSREEFLRLHKQKNLKTNILIQDGLEDKGLKIKRRRDVKIFGERWDSEELI